MLLLLKRGGNTASTLNANKTSNKITKYPKSNEEEDDDDCYDDGDDDMIMILMMKITMTMMFDIIYQNWSRIDWSSYHLLFHKLAIFP